MAEGKLVVLLVDDQAIVAAAVRQMLANESDIELHVVADAMAAEARAVELAPTLILQDLLMPGMDGYTLLAAYRRVPALADVPVIVLSSAEDPRDKSRAFQSGASDYLVKVPDRIELIARIRAHARAFLARRKLDEAYRQLTALKGELEEKNAVLETLSWLDGLTGIANRRRLDAVLVSEWRRAARDAISLAVILIDVDFFKPYNDRLGHQKGDEALQRLAGALAGVARRPGDLAARYGGEEFAVLLPGTDAEGAAQVAENLRVAVSELGIAHPASAVAPHVTVSLGVAVASPGADAADSVEALLRRADACLYRAKREGRNRFAVAVDDHAA
jgi:two-component system chemotaxis family response regulator WspR